MLKCWHFNNILLEIILYFLYRMEYSLVCFLCDKQCCVKCPHCEQVFCCSDDNLQVHRSSKKCLPWVVKFQEGVGRTLVASRDIFPFELIMKDDPLVQSCTKSGILVTGLPAKHRFGSQFLSRPMAQPAKSNSQPA